MDVIKLDKYLKENKLLFKPDFLISVLTRFNKISESMIQKVAMKKSKDSKECKYCETLKESTNGVQQYCKKHKAVHDWESIDKDRTGFGVLFGNKVQLFGRYMVVSMKSDDEGVYVVWMGNDESDSVYCMDKEYFPGIFEVGFNINQLFSENNVVVYKNLQIYWEDNNPRIENIK